MAPVADRARFFEHLWRRPGGDDTFARTLPVVDEYLVLRPLGRGEMGEVFLAFDQMLERHVAIKFIAAIEPDEAARQRFLTEARAAARLQHPNVVTVHRVGEFEGRPYLVSEFVPGRSLEELVKPVPSARVLEIAVGLARGLAAAHRSGVLHRDIKPANAIVADDGVAKLVDFGLAKVLEARPENPVPPADDGAVPLWPGTFGTHARGTPDYMAPEIWRDEPASRRSDVFSLGALLYELCAGRPPFAEVPAEVLAAGVERDPQSLLEVAPGTDSRLAAIIDRSIRYRAADRFESGDAFRVALEELARTAEVGAIPAGNPYRGLRPFEAGNRSLFFGRSAEIDLVIDRLRAQSFVLVSGDSGVGKSSLCRAGVLPRVAEGALDSRRRYGVLVVVPGRRPAATLCAALASHFGIDEALIADRLRTSPTEVVQLLRRHLGAREGLLIFVDQLEELLTLADVGEAIAVDELLAELAYGASGLRLLAAARADFLVRLAHLPRLGAEISRALYFLPPLSPEKTREVIVGPATATGVHFESEELVNVLVSATEQSRAGLPLLQFALAELWEAHDRKRGLITTAALAALGGVAGALARHADGVFAGLPPAQRQAARHVILRLITADGTRARCAHPEITGGDPLAEAALEALVRGRLIAVHEGDSGSTYELAHEALLHGWDTLRSWLHEDADRKVLVERLRGAAAEWERLGRPRDVLFSSRQIAEYGALGPPAIGAPEAEFLRASRSGSRRRLLVRYALVLAVPILVAATYVTLELRARREVDEKLRVLRDDARRALVDARNLDSRRRSERQVAFARFASRDREGGERAWSRAVEIGARARRAYMRASQALEAAVTLDRGDSALRGDLADVLYERALLAESDGHDAERDELLHRLELYDDGGRRRGAWKAPAVLALATSPPDAAVELHRFVEAPTRKLQLSAARHLGRTPLSRLALEPGSYLFVLRARGHIVLRYPLRLRRGETRSVLLDHPRLGDIPAGMVYVPPGTFLAGSTAEESLRRGFFDAPPLHEVTMGAFLIGRTEVTVLDWLPYLEDLPADERRLRTPGIAANVGLSGTINLEQGRDGAWRYRFQVGSHAASARVGEPLRYTARTHRAAQDWRRFPVTGISAADAQAYALWLDRTGRLPGARLCTEHEWERAARGSDGREYPHGYALEPGDANFDETYGKVPGAMGPDEVGRHPASRSPFGLDDMAGNAFEWTTSSVREGEFVGRGGSYFYERNTNRIPNRQVSVPTLRDPSLGFRLCAGYPMPQSTIRGMLPPR